MQALEADIARQQTYIAKHGENNDARAHDDNWEQYKDEAGYNLQKWDDLKNMRDALIAEKKALTLKGIEVKIGTSIGVAGFYNVTFTVIKIDKRGIDLTDIEGKHSIVIPIDYLSNPHYNKNIHILSK
jgi:hypothetical protein